MRLIAIYILTFLFIQNGLSQGSINLDEIKRLTKDSTSRYLYDTLVHDFLTIPHSFEMTKGLNLYYGKLYSHYYKIFNFSDEETKFNQLLSKRKYKQAILVGEEILKNDPVNLEILLKILACYTESDNKQLIDLTSAKINILYNAILHSGAGEDMESAYKVIAVGDEYAMMEILGVQGLTRHSRMKTSSTIDSWKIRDQETGNKRDLYFEVLINMSAMSDFKN